LKVRLQAAVSPEQSTGETSAGSKVTLIAQAPSPGAVMLSESMAMAVCVPTAVVAVPARIVAVAAEACEATNRPAPRSSRPATAPSRPIPNRLIVSSPCPRDGNGYTPGPNTQPGSLSSPEKPARSQVLQLLAIRCSLRALRRCLTGISEGPRVYQGAFVSMRVRTRYLERTEPVPVGLPVHHSERPFMGPGARPRYARRLKCNARPPTTEATTTRSQGVLPPCGGAPPVCGRPRTSVGVIRVGVRVGVRVRVGVFVGVNVGVLVGVNVRVFVGVNLGVFVGGLVGVNVAVGVAEDVYVDVGVAPGGDAVAVAPGGDAVAVAPGGAVEVAPGGAVEVGAGTVEVAPGGAVEVAPGGAVEVAPGGAVEVAPGGAVEVAPGGAVEVGAGAVAVGAGPVGVAVGGVPAAQPETSSLLIVTAPFRARALPVTCVPLCRLMLVSARMFPTNVVFVKRSAELPTCQNTLQGWAPPLKATVELTAVVSVLTVLKMNTPPPLRVSVPVN
jgi:hypothetical protein